MAVRLTLVAVDRATITSAWIGAVRLDGPTDDPRTEPDLERWTSELREAGDPITAIAGTGTVGVVRHGAGATLADVQWESGQTVDGVFAVRCAGVGTFSVANGDNAMAEELPCDGSTHRLDLVAATAPVGVGAHAGLVTTDVKVAVLSGDDLGEVSVGTG